MGVGLTVKYMDSG